MLTSPRTGILIGTSLALSILLVTSVLVSALKKEQDSLRAQIVQLNAALDSALIPKDARTIRDSLVAQEARILGIPVSLALAISWVENRNGDSLAMSPAGAVGLLQVMSPEALSARGEVHGARSRAALIVEVCGPNGKLIERRCNVRVGLRIYQDYLARYGDEYQALAAYNGALNYRAAAAKYASMVRTYSKALEQ